MVDAGLIPLHHDFHGVDDAFQGVDHAVVAKDFAELIAGPVFFYALQRKNLILPHGLLQLPLKRLSVHLLVNLDDLKRILVRLGHKQGLLLLIAVEGELLQLGDFIQE